MFGDDSSMLPDVNAQTSLFHVGLFCCFIVFAVLFLLFYLVIWLQYRTTEAGTH